MTKDVLATCDVAHAVNGFSVEIDANPSVDATVSMVKDGETNDRPETGFEHLAVRHSGKLYLSISPVGQCELTACAVALAGTASAGGDIYSGSCRLYPGDEFYADLRPGRSTVAVDRP